MKLNFTNRIKVFLVAVLVLLVAGMAILGVLGFNQTVDNKASFELQVSLDQNIEKAINEVDIKAVAENSMSTHGVEVANYSAQEMKDGFVLVYKLNANIDEATKTAIKADLDKSLENYNVKSEIKVYENLGDYDAQTGMSVLAVGIAVMVIFAYALIMNKLSGGVAVLCSSVLSALLFTALMAIARIPAQPYFAILASATIAASSALALVLTSRYKAVLKNSDKSTVNEVVENVNKSLKCVFIALVIGLILTAIIAGAISGFNSMFLGLSVLVAGVSAMSAVYMTPFIWTLIKGMKK